MWCGSRFGLTSQKLINLATLSVEDQQYDKFKRSPYRRRSVRLERLRTDMTFPWCFHFILFVHITLKGDLTQGSPLLYCSYNHSFTFICDTKNRGSLGFSNDAFQRHRQSSDRQIEYKKHDNVPVVMTRKTLKPLHHIFHQNQWSLHDWHAPLCMSLQQAMNTRVEILKSFLWNSWTAQNNKTVPFDHVTLVHRIHCWSSRGTKSLLHLSPNDGVYKLPTIRKLQVRSRTEICEFSLR